MLALLPTAAEDILEALPVEELTQELQRKRAERLAKVNAGDTTSSEISSTSPSVVEEDSRSLSSSFQSEAFLHASQSSDSAPPVEGNAPEVKRSKAQLWKEVKITCA